ncbi:MAG: carboxypeptidase-like regulatory domain-containing protein, partial [Bacteroidetes bacterium]
MLRHLFALFIFSFFVLSLNGQSGNAKVTGIITDASTGEPIELVTVYIKGTSNVTESSQNGRYSLDVPANEGFEIVFSRIGYTEAISQVEPIPAQRSRQVDVLLALADSGLEVVVRQSKIEDAGLVREEVSQLKLLPTTTGNLESVLPHIALGTNSGAGGELSSQYNVRGGNYDENLVYVNDFEIYRPQLIRAGQQEGLTFANGDLIRDLTFSSGGFESRYGDKMSSVLDIKYKRPDSLKASAGVSFLGGSAHVEGSKKIKGSNYRRFRYLAGARYKTTRYLLGTLDIEGEYQPNFTDVQAYLTYDLSYNWQLGLMGNYNRSVYQFTPQTRNTALGLINFALQLYSVFEGQEVDDFTTSMGGLSLTYLPKRDHNPFYLKFLTSAFQSLENERIDIIGRYSLSEIETGLGSQSFGEVIAELGTGTQHEFVRNALDVKIYNLEHKGGLELQLYPDDPETTASNFLQWGAKYQVEQMNDWINEWERLDSAGYSLNYDTSAVQLISVLKSRNDIQVNRLSAYVQSTFSLRKESVAEFKASAGVRANYRDINREVNIAPRAQLLYKP